MKSYPVWRVLLALVLLVCLLFQATSASAAPPAQEDDPAAQCAEGVQSFLDGNHVQALPLLEAGFASREQATFADPDDLGICALVLGRLRDDTGNPSGALEAYAVALEVFRGSDDRRGEGVTLNSIGVVYKGQGRYAEALEAYQQALAIRREVSDRTGEGATLNNIGAVYKGQGRYAEALEAYEQALVILREVGDRAGEGTMLSNVGVVYRIQGRYAEALEAYEQALVILREVGDRAGEGTTLNNIGAVYEGQGRYAEALEAYEQALVILREVGDRTGEGTILNNIGVIYEAQGRYAEALEIYEQSQAILREVGGWAEEGTMLNNLGAVYQGQGRYAEALEIYEQALVILREAGDRAGEGTMLTNIGVVYEAQGRYAEALGILQQALVILREVGNRAEEGTTLSNIGAIYDAQGRYAEALETYEQALAIRREVGDRVGAGATLNNIGAVYEAQGRYTEALETYQQALAILREVGDQKGEGTTLNNIGAVYQGQGRYAEALETHEQALVIRRKVSDRAGEGVTLNNIGAVYEAQGRYTEALETLQQALAILCEVGNQAGEGTTLQDIGFAYQQQGELDQALSYYEQAMDVFESVRAVAGSEAGRAGFIAQYAGLYDRAIALYHQQGQAEQAFFTGERGRARAFLDSLATGHVELSDDTAADLLAREQEAYAARQAVQDALTRARALDPPDPALAADLETQLAQAEEEYQAALEAIEARGGQLTALVPGRSGMLDLTQVQALLDDQTTLVSFWVLEDQTLAFVLTHDDFHTVALEVSQDDLTTPIQAFRSFPNLEVAHPESAMTLYEELIAPLKTYLTTSHLAVVPHSVLHYLPFAALTDGQCYLVDDYAITYLPSVSTLPFIQANGAAALSTGSGGAGNEMLILGNPTTGDVGLRPLAFAEREAQAIGELYGVEPVLGAAATESLVREQVSQVGILHLAAHGGYNPYNPLYSAIALAPDGENDGLLEAHESYGLDLHNADLVVLSACETQLGELSAGDEVVGLTRAFFFAGTPSVVASLWSVDDRPTQMLMERFYTHLWEGMGKAESLRQAQLDVRAEYPSPYYWAGFVLSGDGGAVGDIKPEPVPSGPELLALAWVGGVLVMLLILGAGLWSWRRKQ